MFNCLPWLIEDWHLQEGAQILVGINLREKICVEISMQYLPSVLRIEVDKGYGTRRGRRGLPTKAVHPSRFWDRAWRSGDTSRSFWGRAWRPRDRTWRSGAECIMFTPYFQVPIFRLIFSLQVFPQAHFCLLYDIFFLFLKTRRG